MLLAVDIGNTRVKVAVFEGNTLLEQFDFSNTELQNELHFILKKYKAGHFVFSWSFLRKYFLFLYLLFLNFPMILILISELYLV